MKRLIVPLLSVPLVCVGQLPFPQETGERLKIELVPFFVLEEKTISAIVGDGDVDLEALGELFGNLAPQATDMFSSTREALYVLGVEPFEYDLYLGGSLQILGCWEATVYSEQACIHQELGIISDLPNFVHDLNDRQYAPTGTVQLNVLILEDEIAWRGTLGLAYFWWWGSRSDHHWTKASCRAWAIHSVYVIAHELGHCFGLIHNELDSDSGLDMMVSHYAHYDWIKPSNRREVRNHFEHPVPLSRNLLGEQPTVELHTH